MDDKVKPNGPFSGLLVIDLTHALNGPFGTHILCDLGARVIKIENPLVEDDSRNWGPFVNDHSLDYDFVNRGKQSVNLNLKDEHDRSIFLNMVKRADILAENFRPGTMDRLGFSYKELSALNPGLIYASSSGFGQTGPMAQFPAYDTIIQAMSGIMMETGFPDGPPVRVGTAMADLCAGLYLFGGIAAALYGRTVTGNGAHVDIAMFDALISFQEQSLMNYIATGHAPERIGNRHMYIAPFDIYKTKEEYIAICCGNDLQFRKLCAVIGVPALAEDPLFATNSDRVKNQAALKDEIEMALQTDTALHWIELINNAGVPVGPLLTVAQAMQLPQVKARNMLIEADGIKMPGMPIKISGYPDPHLRKGAPAVDQDGDEIRREFSG